MLVYAPGRTYAAVDCGSGFGQEVGRGRGAASVCRVRGLQLLVARRYADTNRGR